MQLQRYGCIDPRFNYLNFADQPVSLVLETLKYFEKAFGREANILSKSTALGWSFLVNGFSEKKIEFTSLLPVPEILEEEQGKKGYSQPTERTIKTITKLIKENRLPTRVLKSLVPTGILSIV